MRVIANIGYRGDWLAPGETAVAVVTCNGTILAVAALFSLGLFRNTPRRYVGSGGQTLLSGSPAGRFFNTVTTALLACRTWLCDGNHQPCRPSGWHAVPQTIPPAALTRHPAHAGPTRRQPRTPQITPTPVDIVWLQKADYCPPPLSPRSNTDRTGGAGGKRSRISANGARLTNRTASA